MDQFDRRTGAAGDPGRMPYLLPGVIPDRPTLTSFRGQNSGASKEAHSLGAMRRGARKDRFHILARPKRCDVAFAEEEQARLQAFQRMIHLFACPGQAPPTCGLKRAQSGKTARIEVERPAHSRVWITQTLCRSACRMCSNAYRSLTGASLAAFQRNLIEMEVHGLICEITGQGIYRARTAKM